LIDIVFLLVIFFVVTSKVGDSQFLSLDLPKTESFEYNAVESINEISVTSDGSVYISDAIYNINNVKEIEQAIFELNNQNNAIILSAEATSLHVWIVGIMDILNKNGFNEVQIRTIEK
jgi:biopolymer transport protein ExbD